MGKRMVTCFASLAVVLGIFFPNSTLHLSNTHKIENRLDTYPITTYFPIMEKGKYEYIAFVGPDNNVWLTSQKGIGPREIQITTDGNLGPGSCITGNRYEQLRWSPDGKYLAAIRKAASTTSIILVDMSNYQVTTLLTSVQGSFDWMPGSQSIVYADGPDEYNWNGQDNSGGLSVLDIKSGDKTKLVSAPAGYRLINPDWAPGSNTGYFFVQQVPVPASLYAPMGIWKEGDPSYQIVPGIWEPSCDWALDSQRMLCSTYKQAPGGQIIKSDVLTMLDASGSILQTLPGDPSNASYIDGQAWSGDNQWIAYRIGHVWPMSPPPAIVILHDDGNSWVWYDSYSWNYPGPIDLDPIDWSPDNHSLLFRSYSWQTPDVKDFFSINVPTRQFELQFSGCEAAWQPGVQ